jgi:hypothetical protein
MHDLESTQDSAFTILGTVEERTAGSSDRFSDSGAGMQGASLTGDESYDAIPAR